MTACAELAPPLPLLPLPHHPPLLPSFGPPYLFAALECTHLTNDWPGPACTVHTSVAHVNPTHVDGAWRCSCSCLQPFCLQHHVIAP